MGVIADTGSAAGEGAAAVAAPEPAAAPPVDSAPAPAAAPAASEGVQDGEGTGQEPAAPVNPHAELFDDIDNMGSAAEAKPPGSAVPAPPTPTPTSEAPDALSTDGAGVETKDTTDAGETQSGDDTQIEGTGDDAAIKAEGDAGIPDADWTKVNESDEQYLAKHVPKAHLQPVRKAYKDAAMARSFLNVNCPPGVWVDNAQKKSGMRFGQIESEILKRNIESDPVAFLGKAFEATADDTGNSEAYQRLLDGMIDTNEDYVLDRFKAKGHAIGQAGDPGRESSASTNGQFDPSKLTDEEIDGVTESAAFQQFQETFPEDAERLQGLLNSTKQLRAENAARTEAEKTQQTDEQKQAAITAAEAQTAKYVGEFNDVYQSSVTSLVNTTLDKDYGLEISADEKEKSPEMAYLKQAKRALILNGGLDGDGDFDNALHKWGQDRPAFKEAAKAMVEFTRAGERENAKGAAKELAPFAKMLLAERVKSDDVKMIDQIIQIVARDMKSRLQTREERGPDSPLSQGAAAGGGASKNFVDEIDDMRV